MRSAATLALLLLVAPARADGPVGLTPPERLQQAKEHFDLGRSRYELGDYDAAIREFKEAYVYRPTALLLYNIAQSHRRAGRPGQALDFYKRFLEMEPDHALAEWRSARQIADELAAAGAPPQLETPPPQEAPHPKVVAPPSVIATPVVAKPAAPPEPRSPRRWRWYLIGAAVLVAAITAAVLGVTLGAPADPGTSLGTFHVFQ